MSILVVSVSHHTTAVDVLARVAMDSATAAKLTGTLLTSDHIDEAAVLSTCNRTELYASVSRFHGALDDAVIALAEAAGVGVVELRQMCAVYFDEGAVAHAFAVAAGLDSMVVGENQILGQVKQALTASQLQGSVGTVLNALFQQALRVGKRVQTETQVGSAGRSLVTAAYRLLSVGIGPLTDRSVLVVGAGAIASLAARTAAAAGAQVRCVNRTLERAERLAAAVGGAAVPFSALPEALLTTEVLITCTGARDLHIDADQLRGSRVVGVVDLALPADVDGNVTELGVMLVNLIRLVDQQVDGAGRTEIAAAQELVAAEVRDFLGLRAGGAGRAHRGGPAFDGVGGGGGRAQQAGRAGAVAGRPAARRGAADRPPGGGQAAALPDRPRAGDGGRSGGRGLRCRAARAVRVGPAGGGRGHLRRRRPLTGVSDPIRIGARTSPLARVQAQHVADLLARRGVESVFVGVRTTGDVDQRALTEIGGTGVFAGAVREALRADRIDVAVHSLKDLPTAADPDLRVAAVPAREDTRDVLVGLQLEDLVDGVRIGTGAPRRAMQLLEHAARIGRHVEVVPIRGNVDTRLGRVRDGGVDAVLLAAAGLIRLGHLPATGPEQTSGPATVRVADLSAQILPPEVMLPAPGQGALALEIHHALPPSVTAVVASLDDPVAHAECLAERGFLAALEAGCTAPVGARAVVKSVRGTTFDLTLDAVIGRTLLSNLSAPTRGDPPLRRKLSGRVTDPHRFGVTTGRRVLEELRDTQRAHRA